MGASPSADLYYGYDLGEMYDSAFESAAPQWWQDAEADGDYCADWEDELARRLGWVEVPFPDDYPQEDKALWRIPWGPERKAAEEEQRRLEAEYKKNSPAYQAWSANLDHKRDLLAQVPVRLSTYGYSEGDSVWALQAIPSIHHVGDWGSIQLPPLIVSPRWDEDIARFVELLDLTVPAGPPAWHLNCSYG